MAQAGKRFCSCAMRRPEGADGVGAASELSKRLGTLVMQTDWGEDKTAEEHDDLHTRALLPAANAKRRNSEQ